MGSLQAPPPPKYLGKIALQRNYATQHANVDALWSMARSFWHARKCHLMSIKCKKTLDPRFPKYETT